MERGLKHLKAVATNQKIEMSEFQRTYKKREWRKVIYFLLNRCSLHSDKRKNSPKVLKIIRRFANEENVLLRFQRISEELRINLHIIQWEKNQIPQAAEFHIPINNYIVLLMKENFCVLNCSSIYTCPPILGKFVTCI